MKSDQISRCVSVSLDALAANIGYEDVFCVVRHTTASSNPDCLDQSGREESTLLPAEPRTTHRTTVSGQSL